MGIFPAAARKNPERFAQGNIRKNHDGFLPWLTETNFY
jgi:hypothetical protein